MSSHRSQTPVKRERSPVAGDTALSSPDVNSTPFKRRRGPTSQAMPAIEVFRTTLPITTTRKSLSRASLQKKSRNTPSRLFPTHFSPSIASPPMMTTSATQAAVQSTGTEHALSIAELVDMFSGSKQPSITASIAAIQSSVEQLAKAYARSIDAADGERMINVLQALQNADDELIDALKTSVRRPSAIPFTIPDTMRTPTDIEMTLKIKSARDEGYEAGLAAAKALYEIEVEKRRKESYSNGFKNGLELARRVQTAHKAADGDVKQR